jgi:cystathionine beta-lyase/cystathionine gamma-synthase
MKKPSHRIETQLIHAGEPSPLIAGAVSMPVFQSATFAYGGEASYHDVRYIRLNNTPNHLVLHQKLAALEGAEAAVVAASGMAAISTSLLAVLSQGDHLLAQNCLYGGTHDFVTKDLPRLGVEHTFIDLDHPETWKKHLRPTTRAIYVEAITNPLVQVGDLEGAVAFARENDLVSMIDSTFATPINFKPYTHGFDLTLHSCTKYMNGHTDIVAGAAIGSAKLVEAVKHRLDHFGGTLDPHACFLLHRGMKTLAVRMPYQNRSALEIARFLEKHPAVKHVNYPGLESHPNHARAKKLFAGFSGMLSFELKGGVAEADRFIAKCTLAICAPSLGGVETLVTRPATTSHAGLPPEERRRLGISDSLIRLSVGLESTEDLIADFDQALASA